MTGCRLLLWLTAFSAGATGFDVREIDRTRIISAASRFLSEQPETITAQRASRSAGGVHDFYSEGDYWWPDPANPDGPYIQKDGMTNPDNFVEHRRVMVRLSIQAAALASAYVVSGDSRYAAHAARHLRAWFLDPATRMNPNLLYAQAIKGRVTGRGIGIIDTIHLVEVAKAAKAIEASGALSREEMAGVRNWFREYLRWMTTHQYGIDERDAKNNHATCWVLQAAAFAELAGDSATTDFCRRRFKEVLLPGQMGPDGSFPLELKRTKPYGYSLFNMEAFAGICRILSNDKDSLWDFTLPDGRGMRKGMEFIFPYIRNKAKWPYGRDVMYFGQWPVRQASLLFAGVAFRRDDYLDLWKTLDPDPVEAEVIRNFPIRQPVLW